MATQYLSRSKAVTIPKRAPGRPRLTEVEKAARKLIKQSDPLQAISSTTKVALDALAHGATIADAAAAANIAESTLKQRMYDAASIAALAVMRRTTRESTRDRAFAKLAELAGVIGDKPAEKEKDRILALIHVLELCGDNYRERVYERAVQARQAGADVPVPYTCDPGDIGRPMPQLVITVESQPETVIEHDEGA